MTTLIIILLLLILASVNPELIEMLCKIVVGGTGLLLLGGMILIACAIVAAPLAMFAYELVF